jgi:hypothetical protein
MAHVKTETLSTAENVKLLIDLPGRWIDQAHPQRMHTKLILDRDSSLSQTYGHSQGSAYNGYHPLFVVNQGGDRKRVRPRPDPLSTKQSPAALWHDISGEILAKAPSSC